MQKIFYITRRSVFFANAGNIPQKHSLTLTHLREVLLYGHPSLNESESRNILLGILEFVNRTKRFSKWFGLICLPCVVLLYFHFTISGFIVMFVTSFVFDSFLPLGDGYCYHSTVWQRRRRRRVTLIPALRVPCINSTTFFDVSSIIGGISRGIFFCLAQFWFFAVF